MFAIQVVELCSTNVLLVDKIFRVRWPGRWCFVVHYVKEAFSRYIVSFIGNFGHFRAWSESSYVSTPGKICDFNLSYICLASSVKYMYMYNFMDIKIDKQYIICHIAHWYIYIYKYSCVIDYWFGLILIFFSLNQ